MEPITTEIVVLGAGPGGYTAAFYAADKGKKVTLVEQNPRLGGICLNVGCIPSKALLHATELLRETKDSAHRGIEFAPAKIDLDKLRAWKESILEKLGQGIKGLAQQRNVQVVHGRGHFEDSQTLRVETADGQKFIRFEKAIIAVGSKPAMPNAFDLGNKRVMTSTEALELPDVPQDLLVVGGGYIGMELGTVYAALGSQVVVLEALPSILTGVDADLGLENTKVTKDDKGFIQSNSQQQTDDPNIYAIGDANGGILLAHRASKEAKIAVEAMLGEASSFDHVVIPAVVYTHPEVAWCGLTESEAKQKGIEIKVAKFLWGASGRALTLDRPDGLTKLIIEPETERILGVGIAGAGAGELISEGVLAVEMGATARDLADSVHPHPTLSETLMEAAESFYGTATHTMSRRVS